MESLPNVEKLLPEWSGIYEVQQELIMSNLEIVYDRLHQHVDSFQLIDTHEHLNPHKNYVGEKPDVLCDYFSHYITSELQSAGMSKQELDKVCDCHIDIIERFKLLDPWLDQVKNTSYCRSLEISAKRIHGIDGISSDTIEELNTRFIKAASRVDYGRYIMKNLCNIEVSLNDNWEDDMRMSTTDLFAPVWQPVVYIVTVAAAKPEARGAPA